MKVFFLERDVIIHNFLQAERDVADMLSNAEHV